MKWKLIFLLSLFGLAMAFATVFWLRIKIESVFWLVIFIICAYLIAKNCSKWYFLHGFLVSIINCIWITAVHIFFFHIYMGNHVIMAQKMADMPYSSHPLRLIAITGIIIGIVSGLILGLFAFIASKLIKEKKA
ncbi:MAG: hypothetical protein ABSD71_00990 [Bacteroidales bacterium]